MSSRDSLTQESPFHFESNFDCKKATKGIPVFELDIWSMSTSDPSRFCLLMDSCLILSLNVAYVVCCAIRIEDRRCAGKY